MSIKKNLCVSTGVEDMAKQDSSPKEKSRDRRKKVRTGIIIENYDRRQNDDKNYAAPERRSGIEKRNGKERR